MKENFTKNFPFVNVTITDGKVKQKLTVPHCMQVLQKLDATVSTNAIFNGFTSDL